MFDWGDIRILLAVAAQGSTLAAAKALGVNQTTVARRIAALEETLQVRLFDRRQDGYRLTDAGGVLIEQARRIGEEAEKFAQLAGQQARSLSGVVRVTSTESLCNDIITPWLSDFMELYPDIRVELIASEQRLDLMNGEADIAIRAGVQPSDPGAVFRKLGDAPWAVYCSPAYAAKRGAPAGVAELAQHSFIGVEGPLARTHAFTWLLPHVPPQNIRTTCVSVVNLTASVRAGHGVGALPCLHMGDLIECFRLPDFGYGYYLVTNASIKNAPRVRAFTDFVVARANTLRALARKPKT